MKVERFLIQACCGKKSLILKTDRPIDKRLLSFFLNKGFKEYQHFTTAGILYVDNLEIIITGPIGSDRLQIKCKIADCDQKLKEFELLIQEFE